MWPYLGFGAAVFWGKETTWGTPVSPTVTLPIVSEGLQYKPAKIPRASLVETGGSRNRRAHAIKAKDCGGPLELEFTFEGMGSFLEATLGATPTTTGPSGGLYTHTFLPSLTLPSYTVETRRGTGTGEIFAGMMVNKGSFTFEVGKATAMLSLELIGKSSGGRQAASTPTFSASRDRVIGTELVADLTWNGITAKWMKVAFTVDNKLGRRNLNGSHDTAQPAPTDAMDLLCRVELEWTDDDMYDALHADDVDDLVLVATDADNRQITFTLKDAYLEEESAPINTNGVIKQTLAFRSQHATEGLEVVVVNTQSSAVAA